MANSPQARKRAVQEITRRNRNMSQRSDMRTAIKNVLKAINAKDATAAQTAFRLATKKIDTLAGRNVIHPNSADRLKSRLNKRVKAAAAA